MQLFIRRQLPTESVSDFLLELWRLVRSGFHGKTEEWLEKLVRHLFCAGVHFRAHRSLVEQEPISLEEAVQRAQQMEDVNTSKPQQRSGFPRRNWKPLAPTMSDKTVHTMSTGEPKSYFLASVKTLNSRDTPIVTLHVGRQPLHALLDTGASVCLIKSSLLSGQQIAKTSETLRGPSGEVVPCAECCDLSIRIGPLRCRALFLVVSQLRYDAIIGSNFLSKHGCTINFQRSTLVTPK